MSPQHVTLLICMIQDDVGYLHRICTCHYARFTVKIFTYFLSPLLPVRCTSWSQWTPCGLSLMIPDTSRDWPFFLLWVGDNEFQDMSMLWERDHLGV